MRASLHAWQGDVALVLLLGGILWWYVRAHVDLVSPPQEDAAMLMRYSLHLATGAGIVWNRGEPPLDGATDFLFMVLVAALHGFGFSLEGATRGLALAAHVATVLLVFIGARCRYGVARPWALAPAAFLAWGPGLGLAAACFGTPLFALTALAAWTLASTLADAADEGELRPALHFALAALVMGLARPEGVLLGLFLLISVLWARRGRGVRLIVGSYLLVFLSLGLTYFLWRWDYFGQPLPNPLERKAAGGPHWQSMARAWSELWALGQPFAAALLAGLVVRRARRVAWFTALPVLLFALIWLLVSDATNYMMRFRYPALPLLLLGAVPVAQTLAAQACLRWPQVGIGRSWAAWPAGLAIAAGLAWAQQRQYGEAVPARVGLHDAARLLQNYASRDFTMATTESGLLPLYSQWTAVDAWGLNDRHIARRGRLDEAYLDQYQPEVILIHAYGPHPDRGSPLVMGELGRPWNEMVATLRDYSVERGYELAACFGVSQDNWHYYYVKRGFADSGEIVKQLRGMDYHWRGVSTKSACGSAGPQRLARW